MTVTSVGTWYNIEGFTLSVEQAAADGLNDESPTPREIKELADKIREAVNAALPEGYRLVGDEFYAEIDKRVGDGMSEATSERAILTGIVTATFDNLDVWGERTE